MFLPDRCVDNAIYDIGIPDTMFADGDSLNKTRLMQNNHVLRSKSLWYAPATSLCVFQFWVQHVEIYQKRYTH